MSTEMPQQLYIRGKNRTYWMRFRHKGQRIHQSTGTSNKKRALALLENKKNELKGLITPEILYTRENKQNEEIIKRKISLSQGLYTRGVKRIYWMRFRHLGQRIHESTMTSNKSEAQIILLKKKYQLMLNHPHFETTLSNNINDIRFEEAGIKAFYIHFSEQRSASANAYKLLVLNNLIGDKYVSQINEATFASIEIALKAKGCGSDTVNKYFSVINVVLSLAQRKFKAPCFPILNVKLAIKKKNIRCISEREEEKILAYLGHTQRTTKSLAGWTNHDLIEIYKVGVATGMRRGEIFSFRVEQVSGQTITLDPEQHKTGDSQGNKVIILSVSAKALIDARIDRLKLNAGYRVFGYSKDAFTRLWGRMKQEIGLDQDRLFTPHCMRHTFASRMAKNGTPIYFLSKMLGHTTVKTTEMYAHLYNNELIEAMNKYAL